MNLNILFIPSWYPTKYNFVNGIFIKRQADAIALFDNLFVIYHDHKNNNIKKIEVLKNDRKTEVIIFNKLFKQSNIFLKLLFLPINLFKFIICQIKMYVIIKNIVKPDIINVNVLSIKTILIPLIINFLRKTPVIVSEHQGPFSEVFKKKNIIEKFMIKKLIKRTSSILVVSDSLKKDMIRCGLNGQYYIVPNVIDVENFKPKKIKAKGVKKRILNVSLFDDKIKNISKIIYACKLLYSKRKDFYLTIVGDGKDRIMLEKYSKDLDLLNKVVFFDGFKEPDDLSKIMNESAFLVSFSKQETFFVAGLEAISTGIPVIATRCGGPEYYINNDNGLLIDVEDFNELVNAIDFMLDNFINYNSINLHNYVKASYSAGIIGKKISNIFNLALATKKMQ